MINKDGTVVVGKKGKSGRKTKQKEIQGAIEKITNDALIELARNKVFKQMQKTSKDDMVDYVRTKELALPVALKGITEKFDLTSKGKSLNYEDDQRKKIAERIIGRRELDTGGSGEKLPD